MDSESKKIVKWNPYSEGYFENPYKHLAECKKSSPVQIGLKNYYILFNHSDVRNVIKNPDFLTSDFSEFFKEKEPYIFKESNACPYLSKSTSKWLMYLDGEDHLKARELVEKGLSVFNYDELTNQAIDEILVELKALKVNNEIDLVDVAAKLPVIITNKMLGLSNHFDFYESKTLAHSLAYSQDLFLPRQVYLKINSDMELMFEFLSEKYEYLLINPDESFFSIIIKLNNEFNYNFSKSELISVIMVLFLGSIETSKDTLSMIFLELLRDKSLLKTIQNNTQIENNILVEEFLRYSSPLQYTVRVSTLDYTIGDITIPANSKLLLCLASANRDEEVFDDAQNIVPNRKYNPHFAFGGGLHSCVGAKLARIELRAFIPKIASFLSRCDISIENAPVWQKTIMMRGLKSLNVVVKK